MEPVAERAAEVAAEEDEARERARAARIPEVNNQPPFMSII